jgi:hypothetical protein
LYPVQSGDARHRATLKTTTFGRFDLCEEAMARRPEVFCNAGIACVWLAEVLGTP